VPCQKLNTASWQVEIRRAGWLQVEMPPRKASLAAPKLSLWHNKTSQNATKTLSLHGSMSHNKTHANLPPSKYIDVNSYPERLSLRLCKHLSSPGVSFLLLGSSLSSFLHVLGSSLVLHVWDYVHGYMLTNCKTRLTFSAWYSEKSSRRTHAQTWWKDHQPLLFFWNESEGRWTCYLPEDR
jgi:hypothetical protein